MSAQRKADRGRVRGMPHSRDDLPPFPRTRTNLTDSEKRMASSSADPNVKHLPCVALRRCGDKDCHICGAWKK